MFCTKGKWREEEKENRYETGKTTGVTESRVYDRVEDDTVKGVVSSDLFLGGYFRRSSIKDFDHLQWDVPFFS